MEAKSQGHCVGCAARLGDQFGFESRSWRRHPRHLAGPSAEVVRVDDVDIAVPGDRSGRASKRSAKVIEG